MTHSSITKEQTVLKSERKHSTSCIKVQFSSLESMMEGLSSVVEAETTCLWIRNLKVQLV